MAATESASSLARWSTGGAVAHLEAAPAGRLHRPLAGVDPAGLDALLGQQLEPLAPADPEVDHQRRLLGGRGHVVEERLHLCLHVAARPAHRVGEVLGEQLVAAVELVGRAGEVALQALAARPAPGPPSGRCPGGPAGPGPRPARPRPGARGAPGARPAPRRGRRGGRTVDSRSSRVISAAASVACTRAVAPSTIRSARCTLRDSWSSAVASSFRATEMPWLNGTWWDVTGRSASITARLTCFMPGVGGDVGAGRRRGPTPRRCAGGRRRSWAGSSRGRPRRRTARPLLLGRPPRRGSGRPRHGSRPTGRARSWAAASLSATAAAEIGRVASRSG